MNMLRPLRYVKSSSGEAEALETLSEKLVEDLRVHIQNLHDFDVMTEDWIEMTSSLDRIAAVSESESQVTKAKMADQDSSSTETTLWECDELALRYILEDGKLNLCLRLLVNVQIYYRENQDHLKPASLKLLSTCERGLGITLKNAWYHPEALQTTDLNTVLNYIHDVLKTPVPPHYLENPDEWKQSPAVMILYYFNGIVSRVSELDEGRVLAQVTELRLFVLVAKHLQKYWRTLSRHELNLTLETFALLCGSEDFETHVERYVDSDDDRDVFVTLDEEMVRDFVSTVSNKRKIRPFLDLLKQFRRELHRK